MLAEVNTCHRAEKCVTDEFSDNRKCRFQGFCQADGDVVGSGQGTAYLNLGTYINNAKGTAAGKFELAATLAPTTGSWVALGFFNSATPSTGTNFTGNGGMATILYRPTGEVDGFVQQVMDEVGVDISAHKPITFDELEDDFFDLIVTLSPEAHHRSLDWASERAVSVEYWPTMDPSTVAGSRQQVVDAYRQTRDSLSRRIDKRFKTK